MAEFRWSGRRERAALLVAQDELSDEQIAESVNVTRRALAKWKRAPEFAARVADLVAAMREAVRARGIAERQNRVDALNERWELMRKIVAERAAAQEMAQIAGGKTGLLVRQLKQVGVGREAQVVEEFSVDTGLLRELREHEKQAAIELGQWQEKREVSGPGGLPLINTVEVVREVVRGETDGA